MRAANSGAGAPRSVRAVDEGVPADAWHRLHPITPILQTWRVIVLILVIGFVRSAHVIADMLVYGIGHSSDSVGISFVVVILLAIIAVIALASWLAWRAASYAVTENAVWYRSGIIMRNQKHARLDRIQSVDIVHPLLGRLVGLGRLDIEVAGGAGSSFTIAYLKTERLEALRAEILARAAGLYAAQPQTGVPVPMVSGPVAPAQPYDGQINGAQSMPVGQSMPTGYHPGTLGVHPVAPERPLYMVPTSRLVASCALSAASLTVLIIGAVITVLIAVGSARAGESVLHSSITLPPIVLAFVVVLLVRFAGEFNFTAAVSPDGIRTRAGLTETRAQTIPPRRIHAVHVTQPLVWRMLGWYRVTITQAGRLAQSDPESNRRLSIDVLLPVGTREEAELAIWLAVRDLGVADPRAFIEAALMGRGPDRGFIPVPPSAALLDPFARARRAFSLTDTVLVVRDGWASLSTSFIPIERIQSVALTQGPIERSLGLADVHAQLVPGTTPHVACHVEAATAGALMSELVARSKVRRAAEPTDKWLLRVESKIAEAGAASRGATA